MPFIKESKGCAPAVTAFCMNHYEDEVFEEEILVCRSTNNPIFWVLSCLIAWWHERQNPGHNVDVEITRVD